MRRDSCRGLVVALYGPRACGKTWLANMLGEHGGANVVTFGGAFRKPLPPGFLVGLSGGLHVVDCSSASPDELTMIRERAQSNGFGFSAVYMGGATEHWFGEPEKFDALMGLMTNAT